MPDKMLITTDQVNPVEIFVEGKYSDLLKFIKTESKIDEPDVSTGAGRKLIRSMSASVKSSKVFIEKARKKLSDNERAKIEKTLSAIMESGNFIKDALTYHAAEVREPLTKWEDDKKAEEEEIKKAQEMLEKHEEALDLNVIWNERKRLVEESKRIEKEKTQLSANQEAIKNFGSVSQVAVNDAVKKQGIAENEAERLREKAIADDIQAQADKDKAVEDERIRVQKIADDKEAKRLDDERIKREVDETRRLDVAHQKEINKQALSGLIEVLITKNIHPEIDDIVLPDVDELGKQIIIAIIQGKIPNVSIKY